MFLYGNAWRAAYINGKNSTSTCSTGFGLLSCEQIQNFGLLGCIANTKLLEIGLPFLATLSEPLEVAHPKVENYWPGYMVK